jgi:hypothetical protein
MTTINEPTRPRRKKGFDEPTEEFRSWWKFHPEARRQYVRPDTGAKEFFGLQCIIVFNTEMYRIQFRQWIKDGRPILPLVDVRAAPIATQRECWNNALELVSGQPF